MNCTHPEAGHLGVLTVVTHISWLSIKTVKKLDYEFSSLVALFEGGKADN